MQTEDFKKQSYIRLIGYVKPYKTILIIGLIAGVLTGGFFGASFFWLKGFIQPFEKNTTSISSNTDTKQYTGSDNDIKKDINLGENSTVSTDKLHNDVKKKNKDLDSVITIAHSVGINLQDSQGNMTLYGLILFVGGFALVWFLKNAATYINNYCMRWVGTKVITDMRNEIFNKILSQSLIFYSKAEVGQLISRCVEDTNQIQSGVSNNIADLTSCPFQILGCVGFIVYVSVTNNNFVLLFIMLFGGLLIMLPIIIIGRKVRKVYKRAYQRIAEVMSRMHEVFTGIVQVKAYHTEKYEFNKFNKVNDTYFSSLIKSLKVELMMSPLTEFVGVCAICVFFIYAFVDKVSLSDIIVLIVPALMAYQPLKALVKVNNGLQKCMAAADRYFNLIDTNTQLPELTEPERLSEFKDRITFENVHFSYDENQVKVLQNINFTLKRGKMVAVVGETGSGKTTIAQLLSRFYDASSGKVTIDGIDVRDLKIQDLRKLVGVVTQNTVLFNDTIANNIAYGAPDTPIEKIIEAAKQANAHKFITDGVHANGYDTVVGEKGFILSGGEKQRIAIARAILRNPPILILDEATSALDTVTERLVQEALNNLMENRTVFAIAHRLSTIKHADTILVLKKGEIVEAGSHAELLAKEDGVYKYLHEIQFSG